MRSSRTRAVAAVMGAVLWACDSPTGLPPDDYELPSPDASLDPTRLALGSRIAPTCVGVDHLKTQHNWALVDIFFERAEGEQDDDAWQGSTADDLKLVTDVGARVLYHFKVPAVRARIFLSRIPDLLEGRGNSIWVREVPDATRYDVLVDVALREPFPHALDRRPIALIGGRVTHESFTREGSVRAFEVILPDQSNAAMRNLLSVDYISHDGSFPCLGG